VTVFLSPKDTISSKDQAGFSLWGVASSLADSVKKNTAEITTGLKETNWRAELEAFSKGVREEEHQLRKETVKRVEVAKEHLPKDVGVLLHALCTTMFSALQNMYSTLRTVINDHACVLGHLISLRLHCQRLLPDGEEISACCLTLGCFCMWYQLRNECRPLPSWK
jgi:hypothetical protein